LAQQNKLKNFIAITSTSQFTPRELESVYTAVKAGLQAFAKSISEDRRVEHTLVFAPGGMNTPFWQDGRDVSIMLDPKRVAEVVLQEMDLTGRYRESAMFRGKDFAEVRAELDPKNKFQK
jgi:short-subunit dehydrogenase